MRKTYQILAWIIVGGVVVQAAAIALGFGGMASHVNQGGVIDKALIESRTLGNFTGEIGFPIHALVGGVVIPLATLLLVGVSFFARVPRGRTMALVVLGLVFVQVMAGYSITDLPYLGLLHGANALALLVSALVAARRAREPLPMTASAPVLEDVRG
jgi:heme A synthase